MSGKPVDREAGAMHTVLGVRLHNDDRDALVELARARGMKHPEMIRQILRHAIAKWAEADAELERERSAPLEAADQL
jgi:hypothetical protein